MRIGSLFSGYGGLDLAAIALFEGSEVAWHCEWADAPARILDHHWPGVPNFRDVTEIDWATVPPADILTGGYPCQPFSTAGQRKGTNDERHLWPFVREAIRHLRPRYTVLENVAGHRTLGFDRVLGDLAEDGMHVRWTSIRASDVGAPHHRERVFILVAPSDTEGERPGRLPGRASKELSRPHRGLGSLSDPNSIGFDRRRAASKPTEGAHEPTDRRSAGINWGAYAPAVRRWERVTRPAPAPTEPNKNGRPRLNAAFAEWMMGLPAGWVTDPAIGISRADQLKAIGNGVCPQQAIAAYSQILESLEVAA